MTRYPLLDPSATLPGHRKTIATVVSDGRQRAPSRSATKRTIQAVMRWENASRIGTTPPPLPRPSTHQPSAATFGPHILSAPDSLYPRLVLSLPPALFLLARFLLTPLPRSLPPHFRLPALAPSHQGEANTLLPWFLHDLRTGNLRILAAWNLGSQAPGDLGPEPSSSQCTMVPSQARDQGRCRSKVSMSLGGLLPRGPGASINKAHPVACRLGPSRSKGDATRRPERADGILALLGLLIPELPS